MSAMRDECIALEAAQITTRVHADGERKTYGEIATEAITKVDQACAAGELDLLWHSWTHDPDAEQSS